MLTIDFGDERITLTDPAKDLPAMLEAMRLEIVRGSDMRTLFPTLSEAVFDSASIVDPGETVEQSFARISARLRLEAIMVDALRGIPIAPGSHRSAAEIGEARAAAAALPPAELAPIIALLEGATPLEEIEEIRQAAHEDALRIWGRDRACRDCGRGYFGYGPRCEECFEAWDAAGRPVTDADLRASKPTTE